MFENSICGTSVLCFAEVYVQVHTNILKISVIFHYFSYYVNIIVTFFIRNPYFWCVFIICVHDFKVCVHNHDFFSFPNLTV